MYLPNIIEKVGKSEKILDLPSRLLKDRIVYLSGEIDEEITNIIIMQLLWLNAESDDDITLFVNSPGGTVYYGLAIKDVIDYVSCKVNTIGIGLCASMGAYILASGTGVRKALPNTRIMIHSVSSGAWGTFHDIQISFEEVKFLQNRLIEDFIKFSKGKLTKKQIEKMTQRDYYMTPERALEFGIIDEILNKQ